MSLLMHGCMRCHTLASLILVGAVSLCPACAQDGLWPNCGLSQHAWQGDIARWLCTRCGATLDALTPPQAPVPTPASQTYIDPYC